MTRSVVTGVGAITPIGLSGQDTWNNLVAGVSGVGPIKAFDPADLPVKIAAEVSGFEASDYMEPRAARRMSKFAQIAVAAARLAADDAELEIDESEQRRAATAIATGAGGTLNTVEEAETLRDRGPGRVSPFYVPLMAPNMAACQVAMQLGLKGPALASVAACASGLYSFMEAKQLIDSGIADVVLAGGSESCVHPLPIAGLSNMKALSRRNDEPQRASRPFDRDRDGFVFGEGAAVMVIESESRAMARGARVYAELAGGGLSCDAHHITAPLEDGSGAQFAIETALATSGLNPDDVDYVSAHGTGTPLNDVSETLAIKLAFGDHAQNLAISSPKSMVGHLMGAAGAVGALAAVMAVYNDVVPPTINLENPDPKCDLDYVPLEARDVKVRAAIANGFGFGGQNGCVAFRKFEV